VSSSNSKREIGSKRTVKSGGRLIGDPALDGRSRGDIESHQCPRVSLLQDGDVIVI